MPYKIAITGRFRTGKDTVANVLAHELGPIKVNRLAFAGALKYELAEMAFNYVVPFSASPLLPPKELDIGFQVFHNRMQHERDINGLGWQWWGEWRRQHMGDDYWTNHPQLQEAYRKACAEGQHIILTDLRHHNEAAWCHKQGFFIVRVVGPMRNTNEQRDPNHPSERYVSELDVHATIANMYDLVHLGEAVVGLYHKQIAPFFAATPELVS